MIRMNITVPDDIVKKLRGIKNKSGFIAETLREKFRVEQQKALDKSLEGAYKKASREDSALIKGMDAVAGDGID